MHSAHLRRTLTGLLLGIAAAGCADRDTDTPLSPSSNRLSLAPDRSGEVIPDHYVVVFKNDVRDPAALAKQLAAQHGGELGHVYTTALRGFSARLSAAAAAALARNPHVGYVEPDRRFQATDVQPAATWALDRIDQYPNALDGQYHYYQTGAGVTAYVLDTGVYLGHEEFEGRATFGVDEFNSWGPGDCNGHGTHVAGTLGGKTYGVARQVHIVSVRVLECDGHGSTSAIAAGIDWVTSHKTLPAVANMSLGGGGSRAIDDALKRGVAAGVVFVVAAGNNNIDACTDVSPARVTDAITVGATTPYDSRSSYSNYGYCVDVWAPGDNITSATVGYSTKTEVMSGTSMATPHVAGVAALFLEERPTASVGTVMSALFYGSPDYVVSNVPGAGWEQPRKLIYSPHASVVMDGPDWLDPGASGTYTWSVDARGKPTTGGTVTYLWTETTDGGATWTVVGTGTSYTRYVGPGDNFGLDVHVDYGFTTKDGYRDVNHNGNPYTEPTDCQIYGTNC